MSGSSDHCRNVIFPLPSQSLFPGWLLRRESNETFGVRTELIPIEFFCIADSVIFIYSHLLPTREWSREHPTTTWWYLHYPCDVPLWQASCSLVSWSLIMEATVWKSLFSDCNPVVSLRPLVVPASNILWGRENILIQTLLFLQSSRQSHRDALLPMAVMSDWTRAPARRGDNPQCRPSLSSDHEFVVGGNKGLKRMSHVKGFCCLYFFKCKLDYFIANLKINDFILIAKHFGDLVPPCGDFWCPRRDCHSTWSSRK